MKKSLKKASCIILAIAITLTIPVASFANTSSLDSQSVAMGAMASKITKPNITVKSVNNNYLKVSWKKCSGASKYSVYRKVAGGKYKRIVTTSKIYYNDRNVRYNVDYYYKVIAKTKTGKTSAYSTVKHNKIRLNLNSYPGYYGVPDFGYCFDLTLLDVFENQNGAMLSYRGGEIYDNGYNLNEVLDLYDELLKAYGFNFLDYDEEDGNKNLSYERNNGMTGVVISLEEYNIVIYIFEN